jgi:hypothetical protein
MSVACSMIFVAAGAPLTKGCPRLFRSRTEVGLGTFFATFTASDWVTGGLAVLAIVVSVLSTIFTLRHNRLYFPKPLFIGFVYVRQPFGDVKQPMTVRQISNRGNGDAYDVSVFLYHADKPKIRLRLDHADLLQPGESMSKAMSGVTGATPIERYAVTWRQAPRMSKVREMVFKVKMSKPTQDDETTQTLA